MGRRATDRAWRARMRRDRAEWPPSGQCRGRRRRGRSGGGGAGERWRREFRRVVRRRGRRARIDARTCAAALRGDIYIYPASGVRANEEPRERAAARLLPFWESRAIDETGVGKFGDVCGGVGRAGGGRARPPQPGASAHVQPRPRTGLEPSVLTRPPSLSPRSACIPPRHRPRSLPLPRAFEHGRGEITPPPLGPPFDPDLPEPIVISSLSARNRRTG